MKTTSAIDNIDTSLLNGSAGHSKPTDSPRSVARACDILLRPASRADAVSLAQMHQRLSPESLFFRFFRPHRPSADEMAAICDLAPETGAAFVAVAAEAPRAAAGLIYYIRNNPPDQQTAEFAVAIDEGFQGQGLGRALFEFLCRQALARGILRLEAYVHPDNRKMRGLLASARHPVSGAMAAGVMEFQIDLTQKMAAPPSTAMPRPPIPPIQHAVTACFRFAPG